MALEVVPEPVVRVELGEEAPYRVAGAETQSQGGSMVAVGQRQVDEQLAGIVDTAALEAMQEFGLEEAPAPLQEEGGGAVGATGPEGFEFDTQFESVGIGSGSMAAG